MWEFQESLGRYDLSEQELYEFLRIRCFGKRTLTDRLLRIQRISLKDALRPRSEKLPSPLDKALNEIVWRIARRWLFQVPDHRVRPQTGDLRISGRAIHRVICKLYGIKDLGEIEVVEAETPGGVRSSDARVLHSPRCPLDLAKLLVR